DFHADDFRHETARRLRRCEPLLRAFRPAILVFARDVEACNEILRVPPRMLAGERVIEAVAQHAVVDLSIAHALAPAPAWEQVRSAVHVLHASGDGGVDVAEPDLL